MLPLSSRRAARIAAPECAGHLRLRGDDDRLAQRRLQAPLHAGHQRHAAGEHDRAARRSAAAIAATRVAIDACTPATMSSGVMPEASRPMISVSANTTHMLLMMRRACGFGRPARPGDASRTPSRVASDFQEAAVPAAQRSFITKSPTVPSPLSRRQLAVLPADVDDRPRLGHRMPHAPGLAGDLGDRRRRRRGSACGRSRWPRPGRPARGRCRSRRSSRSNSALGQRRPARCPDRRRPAPPRRGCRRPAARP